MTRPVVLAISPHLDDAVFSVGGTLARHAREGCRVVVATVFTASVAEPRGFALACQLDKGLPAEADYMALRRDEDAAACSALGAESLWLPFVEAPHRGYDCAAALFGPVRSDDDDVVEAVAQRLATLLDLLQPIEVLAPQAIGAHVDHVVVYRAVRRLGRAPLLWADFPYVARAAPRASPFAGDLVDLPIQTVPLDCGEIRQKSDATVAYATQIGFQFGSAVSAEKTITALGAVEIFVRQKPARQSPFHCKNRANVYL